MARYRYQRGERPLEGFTIEYGLGVGGFGEVYFATSDSGREVALKAVQNFHEIELRGIRHCMNLKSPYLVTIFDVRHNQQQEPFVVMEYVRGPSLRQLIDAEPDGLGPTKAAFFVREIAKGLSYLHGADVVHRDLKPHNVFYEDGFVKIGDYSLCKLISITQHSGHTMTVGTVHYMAPEISKGRYDASVDIYALGIMLFEMLTGSPPFVGDSVGEILMKHMTEEPDLSALAEPFRSTVAKALQKDPQDRFQSVEEMVESVFGEEHVQNSVVEFNPQELTVVADHVGRKALLDADRPVKTSEPKTLEESAQQLVFSAGTQLKELKSAWSRNSLDRLDRDPMPWILRWCMTAAIVGLVPLIVSANAPPDPYFESDILPWMLGTIVSTVLALRFVQHQFLRYFPPDTRAATGLMTAATTLFIALPMSLVFVPLAMGIEVFPSWDGGTLTLILALIPIAVFDWQRTTHAVRSARLDFVQVAMATGVAFILAWFAVGLQLGPSLLIAPAITFAIATALQISSPFRMKVSTPVAPSQETHQLASQERTSDTLTPQFPPVDAATEWAPTAIRTVANRRNPTALDASAVVPAHASPYARWPLVALAGLFFVCPIAGGMHRFYVGKRSSGFVWLFTLGLAGIGQILDLIRIIQGRFYDANGRPVLAWETSQAPPEQVNRLSAITARENASGGLRSVTTILSSIGFTTATVLAGFPLISQMQGQQLGFDEMVVILTSGITLLIVSVGLSLMTRRGMRRFPWRELVSSSLVGGVLLSTALNGFPAEGAVVVFMLLPISMLFFPWPHQAPAIPTTNRAGAELSKSEEVLV